MKLEIDETDLRFVTSALIRARHDYEVWMVSYHYTDTTRADYRENAKIMHTAEKIVRDAELEAKRKEIAEIGNAAQKAPAKAEDKKPRRNCDVGTAKEQYERWQAFCNRNYKDNKDCTGCPCDSDDSNLCDFAYCFALWAQMPCEEGGAE